VALRITCIENVKFRLLKQGQVVSMQDIFTAAKTSTWQHKTLVWAACSPRLGYTWS